MNDKDLMLSKKIQDYYEKQYDTYQASVILHNERTFLERLRIGETLESLIPNGSKILDIASGSCQWIEFISSKIDNYIAFDSNKSLLDHAMAKWPEKVTPMHGNIFERTSDPSIYRNVDILLLSFFLSHFSDETIRELFLNIVPLKKTIIIIDSFQHIGNLKFNGLELVKRKNSNHEIVEIPKRYFLEEELIGLAGEFNLSMDLKFKGMFWFLCVFNVGH
jgi:hypothetical protein